MPRLVEPTIELHAAWLDAYREWGVGMHEDGFGVLPSDELTSATGFSTWLERLDREENGSAVGRVDYRCVYRWIVDGDAVVGGIALRHGDDNFIRGAGHIGYGIRPSARRQGLATWALGQILDVARDLRLGRVLLVCEADNAGSAVTIERNAGVFERIEETRHGPVRRYWITL